MAAFEQYPLSNGQWVEFLVIDPSTGAVDHACGRIVSINQNGYIRVRLQYRDDIVRTTRAQLVAVGN